MIQALKPSKIYLFGSFVRGNSDENSDLDFYLIINDNNSDIAALTAKAYRSIRNIKKHPVDIVIATEETFAKKKNIPSVSMK